MLRAVTPPIRLLGMNHGTLSKTDTDTDETLLWSLTVPGGLMGLRDSLRIIPRWGFTNNGTNKSMRIKANSTNLYAVTFTTQASLMALVLFSNRDSLSSQVGVTQAGAVFSQNTGTLTFTAIDTAQDFTIGAYAQWGAAGTGSNSIRLESIMVEYMRGL